MHRHLDAVVAADARNDVGVANVPSNEPSWCGDRSSVPARKIVQDDDGLRAGGDQLFDNDRSDITSASGNKDSHALAPAKRPHGRPHGAAMVARSRGMWASSFAG
jgi:hypothetical protein